MSIQEFNSTVVDMINDLASAIPKFTELTVVANLATGMFRLDPNNTTVLDTFYPIVTEYESLLTTRDEGVVHTILQGILPSQYSTTVNYVWDELAPANKETVWQYIQVLKDQAFAVKMPQPDHDITTNGLPADSHLFVLYNNVWKEFLSLLIKGDSAHLEMWTTALSNLDKVPSSSSLHTLMVEALKNALQPVKSVNDIMTIIMPTDAENMKKELGHDYKTLEGIAFPLNEEITLQQVVGTVQQLESSLDVTVYWHYVKVLTSVLAECPPELAGVLSSMSSGLIDA